MQQKLEELMDNCVQYFEQHSFSIPRIERYKYFWKKKLMPFMANKSILDYDASVGEEFIHSTISGGPITAYKRDIIRSIYVLSEFNEKGSICKRISKSFKRELSGPIGLSMEKFLLHLQSLRRCKSTISEHRIYLYRLLTFLKSKQIHTIEEINEHQLIIFLSTAFNNKINVISSIRVFCKYLYEEQLLAHDLSISLRNFKWTRKEKLPSVYSKKEVLQIEASIQRFDTTGKRDYAMILLATRLAIRASDIAHLSFDHLDWENSTITFFQFKTGKEIKLPLLTEVGEALIDYLKYGRKHCLSEKIFLYTRAPFSPMRDGAVSSAISRIIKASGVDTASLFRNET